MGWQRRLSEGAKRLQNILPMEGRTSSFFPRRKKVAIIDPICQWQFGIIEPLY